MLKTLRPLRLMANDQIGCREGFVGSEHPDQNSDVKHRDRGEQTVSVDIGDSICLQHHQHGCYL